MNTMEFRSRFAAYDRQQQELISVIKQYGGRLTQQEFDVEFESIKSLIRQEPDGSFVRIPTMEGVRRFGFVATIELGSPTQGSWSQWLDLLQNMCLAGIVRCSGAPPNVVYELVDEEGQ